MPQPPSPATCSARGVLRRRPPAMDNNWRQAISQDSRNRIVKRIMETLQRRMHVQGQDGVKELRMIANRFEEKVFFAATDQYDYLRKISLKMLNLEMKAPNPPNSALSSSASANQNSGNKRLDANSVLPKEMRIVDVSRGLRPSAPAMDNNWRQALSQDSRNKIVNRIMDTLQRHMHVQGQDGVNELRKIAFHFEEKTFFAATDQHDYLRKISLKMLNLEMKAPNPPNSAL